VAATGQKTGQQGDDQDRRVKQKEGRSEAYLNL
jgi:hypothetical protein